MRVDKVKELVELVERSQIDELEVRHGWWKVRIVRNARGMVYPVEPMRLAAADPGVAPATAPAAAPPPAGAPDDEGLVPIVSPMVGTFYRASSPAAPSYVEAGQRVEVGQVVCIVVAM
jgi:acetyl-CoA carboxylase biotin carboxyl carrier protein